MKFFIYTSAWGLAFFILLSAWGIEQLPVGTRPIGMGEAFVGVADDGNAVYWNPAGISGLQRDVTLTGMRADLLGQGIGAIDSSGLIQNYVSVVWSQTKEFAVGIDWMNISIDDDELGFRQDKFNLALSYKISRMVSVGVNTKYVSVFTGLDGTTIDTASGFGWDAGFLLKPHFIPELGDKLQVGLMVQDLAGVYTNGFFGGTSIRHDFTGLQASDNEIEDENILPTYYRVGVCYKPERNWLIALDLDDRFHLGTEFSPSPIFAIRGGLQKDFGTGEFPTFSLGASLKYDKSLVFDVAYQIPPTLPANLQISVAGSFDIQRSPIKIRQVKIRDEGIFIVHHVFYAKKEKANKIIIKQVDSQVPQKLDDYATVLKMTPHDKTFGFRRDVDSSWEVIEIEKELQKGGMLRIPVESRLRIRMNQTGDIYEYTTAELDDELQPNDKIGRIWLENKSDKLVDVTVKLMFNEYMNEFRQVTDTHKIPPKSMASIALQHLTFLNSKKILHRRTNGPVDAQIAVAATTGEKIHRDVLKTVPDFQLNGINTIKWEKRSDLFKLGSFISPKDKAVKDFAGKIAAMYGREYGEINNEAIRQVLLLFATLKAYGIEYKKDPDLSSYGKGIDSIAHAQETLKRVAYIDETGKRQKIGVGDCDDSTVLLATMMLALDVEPLLILHPGHLLLAFNTRIPRHAAEQISVEALGRFKKRWYYVATQKDGTETAWIPLETTLLREGYDFSDAWEEGLKRIETEILFALPVSLAHRKYKPADIYNDNEDQLDNEFPSKDQINLLLNKERSLTWLKTLSTQAETRQTSGVTADD